MSLKHALVKHVLVQDGSTGTELENILPLDHPLSIKGSPLWSTKILLQEPSLVTQVHRSYLDVGSQMLITSTYQASQLTLKKHAGLELPEARDVWRKAVCCAKEAIDSAPEIKHKTYIAGSVGPYGAYLANGAEYSGDYDVVDVGKLAQYHEEMVKCFIEDADVDVIAFETIPRFEEVKAIFELLEKLYTSNYQKEFYVALSCKDESTLVDGTPLSDVILYMVSRDHPLVKANFVGTGCNCVPYEIVEGFIRTVNATCEDLGAEALNLIIYPNLGFENDPSNPSDYAFRSSVEGWRRAIEQWSQAPNVRIIGGCCSTGPREVQVIHDYINAN